MSSAPFLVHERSDPRRGLLVHRGGVGLPGCPRARSFGLAVLDCEGDHRVLRAEAERPWIQPAIRLGGCGLPKACPVRRPSASRRTWAPCLRVPPARCGPDGRSVARVLLESVREQRNPGTRRRQGRSPPRAAPASCPRGRLEHRRADGVCGLATSRDDTADAASRNPAALLVCRGARANVAHRLIVSESGPPAGGSPNRFVDTAPQSATTHYLLDELNPAAAAVAGVDHRLHAAFLSSMSRCRDWLALRRRCP